MDQATLRVQSRDKELVPRILIRGLLALILVCMALTSVFVWSDQPKDALLPESQIVAQREVELVGDMSGAAKVFDTNGALIADLSPEEGGFISGMWRVLQRERTKAQVSLEGPVLLVATENGRLRLTDPSTGWSADLMGFGQDNSAAFAKLLVNQEGNS